MTFSIKTKEINTSVIIRLIKGKKWLKIEQYELPEEAAGLSVVLTVRYICEEQITKQNKNFILIKMILPQIQHKKLV